MHKQTIRISPIDHRPRDIHGIRPRAAASASAKPARKAGYAAALYIHIERQLPQDPSRPFPDEAADAPDAAADANAPDADGALADADAADAGAGGLSERDAAGLGGPDAVF